MKKTALIVTLLFAGIAARAADERPVLDVWPGKPPGDKEDQIGSETATPAKPTDTNKVLRITNVTKPTLTVFRPAKDKDTGACVVICPGGAYRILAWDLEGEEVAAWLNTIGVTGVVLKYRVPHRPGDTPNEPPLWPRMDAQRAVSLVRSKAKEWGIDEKKIGILGFSAGGHLAASVATNFDKRSYEKIDAVDAVSCRPDFAVLVYPAYLTAKQGEGLAAGITVTKETPPTFFAHAGNDPVTPESSVRMYLALKRAGVPSELHVYSTGGHGFGLRPSANACSTWPKSCAEWMKAMKIVAK